MSEELHMTIQFEMLKARLLADPKVKAEYDVLDTEFDAACLKEQEATSHATMGNEGGPREPPLEPFPK
jgi:hypothetical protein